KRLVEPEAIARESVATIGQAIRREVAAMGDGVERALARAADLEILVANKVSALEHAHSDNDARIRGLIAHLAHEREALAGQAEQVSKAIGKVHLDLTQEISSATKTASLAIDEALQSSTKILVMEVIADIFEAEGKADIASVLRDRVTRLR